MPLSGKDRTEEVDAGGKEIFVKATDYCMYFEKHPYTFLCRNECWTCNYSDFGIDTGNPTEAGVCKYKLMNHK
jgi:hypothetical protein